MHWYILLEKVDKDDKVVWSVEIPVWAILLFIMALYCIIRIQTYKT